MMACSAELPAKRASIIHQAERKGQAVSGLPQAVATSLLIKEVFWVCTVKRSVRLAYPDRDRETAVRYSGGSLKFVLRFRITFGAAVIVVDFLYNRMAVSPLESSRMATAENRSMAPGTVIGPEAGRYPIMKPPVIFVPEAVYRTIMVALGLISKGSVTS
jgi:hypothetical protein